MSIFVGGPILVLLGVCVWGIAEIRKVASVDAAMRQAPRLNMPATATPAAVEQSIERLETVAARVPDDAELHERIARLLVDVYRLRRFDEWRGIRPAGVSDEKLWEATAPVVIHALCCQMYLRGQNADLALFRQDPLVKQYLIPAIRHLALARQACPLIARVHSQLAQLIVLVQAPGNDRIHLERSRRVDPSDPDKLFLCGTLDFQAGRADSAFDSWQRSLTLSPRHLDKILSIAGGRLPLLDFVYKVLPDSPSMILSVARRSPEQGVSPMLREFLLTRAEKLANENPMPDDEKHFVLGSVLLLHQQCAEAASQLRQGGLPCFCSKASSTTSHACCRAGTSHLGGFGG